MTTRDDLTTYTSERAIRERRAPDGGLFIPHRIPKISREELRGLWGMAPRAQILFVARRFLRLPDQILDHEDSFVRVSTLGNRIAIGEIFPERTGSFRRYSDEVAKRLCSNGLGNSVWLAASLRVGAIAAAIAGYKSVHMVRTNSRVDISMVAGDLFGPMSAYLAREMGLPVGDILCCCNENNGFWDLLHHGEFRTDQIVTCTGIREADFAVPDGLECLIALCCGREEVMRYLDSVRSGRPYFPGEEALEHLRSIFRATVVTGSGLARGAHIYRCMSMKAGTALAMTGLMDYKAGNGPGRPALVIAE